MKDLSGRRLDNHYEILAMIGQGGMAQVYRAFDHGVERVVAIKVMDADYARDKTFRQRFVREARAVAGLEHMHIVPLYSYGTIDDRLFLVMRYMPHGSLYDLMRRAPIPFNEVARILKQVATALDYAHRHNVLHRDIKPENVLVDENRNAFLTDFGLALRTDEDGPRITGEFIVGTPHFMSPEQCRGKPLTPAADQYALACVAYDMLALQPPFDGDSAMDIMWKQVNEPPPPPSTHRSDIPERTEKVLNKALAKTPAERYESCSAFANALAASFERGGRLMKGSSVPIGLQRHIDSVLSSFDDDDEDEL
jgi:serine/threonine-protein kinase